MTAATLKATKTGRRLKQFTLGHQSLLELFESVFSLDFDVEIMLRSKEGIARLYYDFILSAFICTHTKEQCEKKLSSRFAGVNLLLWRLRMGFFDLKQEAFALMGFLKACRKEPRYKRIHQEEPGRSSLTLCEYLTSKTISEIGKSEAEAERTPYSVAMRDYCVLLESKGAIKLLSDDTGENEEKFAQWAMSDEAQANLDKIAASLRAKDWRNRCNT